MSGGRQLHSFTPLFIFFFIYTQAWDDIGYNFLIGGDGRVYEGRGWDRQGAHARGYNHVSIGIAFIGSFGSSTPTGGALSAARELIASGKRQNKISRSYTLYGHRQLGTTECPGSSLYGIIHTLRV